MGGYTQCAHRATKLKGDGRVHTVCSHGDETKQDGRAHTVCSQGDKTKRDGRVHTVCSQGDKTKREWEGTHSVLTWGQN